MHFSERKIGKVYIQTSIGVHCSIHARPGRHGRDDASFRVGVLLV